MPTVLLYQPPAFGEPSLAERGCGGKTRGESGGQLAFRDAKPQFAAFFGTVAAFAAMFWHKLQARVHALPLRVEKIIF